MPRVTVANRAARESVAAPSADARPRFLSQPRWKEHPSARNGSSSSNAPHAQPTSVADIRIDPCPAARLQLLLDISITLRLRTTANHLNKSAWVNCTEIRKATAKMDRRHPLRRCPSSLTKKLCASIRSPHSNILGSAARERQASGVLNFRLA